MAFTTTSNFAGKAAGFYISAALKASNSLDYLTMIENIKYKSNIQAMNGSALVVDATCDFTAAGNLALTEKVLEPKNLQINLDLCKKTLLDSRYLISEILTLAAELHAEIICNPS